MTSISKSESSGAADLDARKFQSFANIVLSAWEQWMALNLDTARSLCSSVSVNARAMVDEALRTQMAALEEGIERTADYVAGVSRLGVKAQAELAQLQADTVIESTGSVPAFLENVGSPGPRAAYDVIAVMKSAVGNSSAIYEKLIRTTREMADSNITVATRALAPIRPASRRTAKSAKNPV